MTRARHCILFFVRFSILFGRFSCTVNLWQMIHWLLLPLLFFTIHLYCAVVCVVVNFCAASFTCRFALSLLLPLLPLLLLLWLLMLLFLSLPLLLWLSLRRLPMYIWTDVHLNAGCPTHSSCFFGECCCSFRKEQVFRLGPSTIKFRRLSEWVWWYINRITSVGLISQHLAFTQYSFVSTGRFVGYRNLLNPKLTEIAITH